MAVEFDVSFGRLPGGPVGLGEVFAVRRHSFGLEQVVVVVASHFADVVERLFDAWALMFAVIASVEFRELELSELQSKCSLL